MSKLHTLASSAVVGVLLSANVGVPIIQAAEVNKEFIQEEEFAQLDSTTEENTDNGEETENHSSTMDKESESEKEVVKEVEVPDEIGSKWLIDPETLTISQSEGSEEKIVVVSVQAVADEAVQEISVNFKSPSTDIETVSLSMDQKTGVFVGKILLDDSIEKGNWRVHEISVKDMQNDAHSYYNLATITDAASDTQIYDWNEAGYLVIEVEKEKSKIDAEEKNEEDTQEEILQPDEELEQEDSRKDQEFIEGEIIDSSEKLSMKEREKVESDVAPRMNRSLTMDSEVGDVEYPKLDADSLKVEQTGMQPGDEVKISLKASDDKGISYVFVYYDNPVTGGSEAFTLKWNTSTGRYEDTFSISENYADGVWKVDFVALTDTSNHKTFIRNKEKHPDYTSDGISWLVEDLTAGNFTVDRGKNITNERTMLLYTSEKAQLRLDTIKDSSVVWKSSQPSIVSVNEKGAIQAHRNGEAIITATRGNEVETIKIKVVSPLDKVTVLDKTETYRDMTFDGDVYINSEAVVTFNNVTVTGNVYVLGALRGNSIKVTGGLYGNRMQFGGYPTLYNGTVVLSGTNSVPSMTMSSSPITDIPVRIADNPIKSIDGKLSFVGTAIDVADMYIGNQLITVGEDRKFVVEDYQIGDAKEFSLTWKTVFGNSILKKYQIDRNVTAANGDIHHLPILKAEDLKFNIGQNINLLSKVSASDAEDGDLTKKVIIKENNVDSTKRGVYKVVYSVTDSHGAEVQQDATVTISQPLVKKVTLNTASLELKPGEKQKVTASIEEQDNPNYTVKWSTSNSDVASVNQQGEIAAKSVGTAIIAITAGSQTANMKVTVKAPLEKITLSSNKLSLLKGKNHQLSVSYSPINTTDNRSVTWTSSDSSVVKVDSKGNLSAVNYGTATITAAVGRHIAKTVVTVPAPTISYQTHVQSIGWQKPVKNGAVSGTSGQAKRLEGIVLNLEDTSLDGGVQYRTHVQSYGWMDWVDQGKMSGTEGEAKRLKAIQIQLTSEMAEAFDVYYRVHAESYGWLDWAKNGQEAGTSGLAKRLEAIEVKVVPKGAAAPGSTKNTYVEAQPNVVYSTHVQSYGWQLEVRDGKMSGTEGKAKRLEGIKINLVDSPYSGNIVYSTHVQSYGWQDPVRNGRMSGTSGKAKRLEGIRIQLTGEISKHYDIYYRVHAESYGWLDWAKNGQEAGTQGKAKRLEGIEILLVPKGNKAPGSTVRPFVK